MIKIGFYSIQTIQKPINNILKSIFVIKKANYIFTLKTLDRYSLLSNWDFISDRDGNSRNENHRYIIFERFISWKYWFLLITAICDGNGNNLRKILLFTYLCFATKYSDVSILTVPAWSIPSLDARNLPDHTSTPKILS